MKYTGVDFVIHFFDMLDELNQSMAEEFREVIVRFRFLDPHDLVPPDIVFRSKEEMLQHLRNLIWIDHIEDAPSFRN
ncbi:hypothetical protein SAMN04488104_10444 [Algoriphagus faecimaris]|uniref:Uncharacterized protein n=1 Tax=Algoriphagus faecimaris TaxID=686796 RepID=A0A1G6WG04_9BACT|nr:hypothetical protein [Algoriphagus faecimaris]SDD64738.1 hypothetical protein SAMN04488104_10444 [Algoriphagus faecimaris]